MHWSQYTIYAAQLTRARARTHHTRTIGTVCSSASMHGMTKMRAHIEDAVLAPQVRDSAFRQLEVRISIDRSRNALQRRRRQQDARGVEVPRKSHSAARTERVTLQRLHAHRQTCGGARTCATLQQATQLPDMTQLHQLAWPIWGGQVRVRYLRSAASW